MKRKLAILGAFAVACSTVLFGACTNAGEPQWYGKTYYGIMNMDTAAQLIIRGEDSKEGENNFASLSDKTEEVLRDIESSLSVTVETSSIAAFNSAGAGEKVEIDKTAYEVLSLAKSVYELTEGYYNPAVYYSVQAYGFDGNKNFAETAEDLPKDETIQKYTELASHFNELTLIPEDGKYYAVKPAATVEIEGAVYNMKIDLGGIGKGYAVDKINGLIDEYGYKYGYFNLGSSSIAFKTFSEEEPYEMRFINARGDDQYLVTNIENKCISTSGDYEQYFIVDGVRYCHVFNPMTGKPVQTGIMTATVIGGSAAEDDAVTTALMAMGREKAVEFINEKLSGRLVAMSVEEEQGYGIITNIPEGQYAVANTSFVVLNTLSDGKIVLGD